MYRFQKLDLQCADLKVANVIRNLAGKVVIAQVPAENHSRVRTISVTKLDPSLNSILTKSEMTCSFQCRPEVS